MGKTDTCTKMYMSNPRIFADAFNYYFFHGKQVVKPEELTVQDITEIVLPTQKFRDILKLWTIMTDEEAAYMLLGIENQANIHYAMPVRNMLYDALNYSSQIENIGKKHRKAKDTKGDEFLSGFQKKDKIKPILTLVIYWGTKEWDAPRSLFEMFDIKEELSEIIKSYVNNYKIHIIVPNEIEEFEQFSTELGYCFRYIQSSTQEQKLIKLLNDYKDIYSNFDLLSGHLLETVTNTKIPISAKKEDSVNMCKAIEEMIQSTAKETAKKTAKETAEITAKNFFKNGADLQLVIKSVPVLTEEEIIAIYNEVQALNLS